MSQLANLTILEVDALTDLDGGLNLTDGHARLVLTEKQAAIVARIPEMFTEACRRPFPDIEHEAHEVFLRAIGQHSAPVGTGRILSCYSSTLATDIVARALPSGATVAVLHPTFDNIADLMVTRGLSLVPLSEAALLDQDWPGPPVSAIVVTHPNNPTGLITPEGHLRSLAEHAVRHGQTVIIDASFRGQVREAQYDTYAVLDEAGADWIVIEDTGKLWPTHELKIGLLAYSERTVLPIMRAFSESLLAASPVVLQLVRELAVDWSDGGYERARELVERNRAVVAQAVEPVGLRLADPASQISVARIGLPADGPDSSLLHKAMLAKGVHVLPCAPFHWADPEEGLRYIRLSLARPYRTVETGARMLAEAYRELR
ncbi:aspartate/methionine/tyrosine aminotransferase [Streptosporangium becharense]|uniref:Aspartate/methionine/tyrosine aminotransferase n=1 Tax=Streptosporangium becharense TaxID=1816182 RepID=A0A7W9MEE0_9ACTN|nr:aminotransferase class I/II-fold pyridoxal phosphate-dependent enzyme [Streptosporangium becharense]MBB2914111.1 aspartate/methionine/tyrosine aminotransferase [Streptosporangium becharense]MBB5817138.1 aspartate/methionine/tyrosine aminotransferase [Streptosporangium becharense]